MYLEYEWWNTLQIDNMIVVNVIRCLKWVTFVDWSKLHHKVYNNILIFAFDIQYGNIYWKTVIIMLFHRNELDNSK